MLVGHYEKGGNYQKLNSENLIGFDLVIPSLWLVFLKVHWNQADLSQD